MSKKKVKHGQNVSVHYTGTLDDGTEFDSSVGQDPISFTIGTGQMIPGFDKALPGMKVGEKKNISITAADAYGQVKKEAFQTISNDMFPDNLAPEVGRMVYGQTQEGQQFSARVHALQENTVTLDFNHPMAGKNLNFEIELVSVNEQGPVG